MSPTRVARRGSRGRSGCPSHAPAPEARAVDRNHNSDYTRFVKRVTFSPAAVRQYKRLPATARSLLKKKMHERLAPRKKPAIASGYVGCLRTQTSSFA